MDNIFVVIKGCCYSISNIAMFKHVIRNHSDGVNEYFLVIHFKHNIDGKSSRGIRCNDYDELRKCYKLIWDHTNLKDEMVLSELDLAE